MKNACQLHDVMSEQPQELCINWNVALFGFWTNDFWNMIHVFKNSKSCEVVINIEFELEICLKYQVQKS